MKVGDLVTVGHPKHDTEFVTVITAICLPEEQVNGMLLVEVLEVGMKKWYPIGYIKVINESR